MRQQKHGQCSCMKTLNVRPKLGLCRHLRKHVFGRFSNVIIHAGSFVLSKAPSAQSPTSHMHHHQHASHAQRVGGYMAMLSQLVRTMDC